MGDNSVPQARYFLLREKNGVKYIKKTLLVFFLASLLIASAVCAFGILLLRNGFIFTRRHSFTYYKEFHDHSFYRAVSYSKLPENNITIPKISNRPIKSPKIDNYRLVCYYNFPNRSFNLERQLTHKRLDPDLCTHVNVGFGSIQNNTIYLSDYNRNVTRNVSALKAKNKNLKVLLSISGFADSGFAEMVQNHANRKMFIKSMLSYVKEFKLDGIDLDWEFPNADVYNSKERMHFTQLLYEIREEINRQKKHKFLLTVAVASPYFIAMNSYDISYMNDYVDFINLMTYDFHFYTKWTPFTGINSPLYSLPHDIGIFGTLNINYSAHFWMSQGMEKNKINIGLPTYGHTYKLINPNNNGISAPAIGFGNLGHNGFIDYSEVCAFLSESKVLPNFDDVSKSPYATHYQDWISYDDIKSLSFKAEYIRENNFGGAMVYSLNSDDYTGDCADIKNDPSQTYPLIRQIRDILLDPNL
ncbi:glycoside hydrolase [Oryctes borbonicus]|uniref:Glycoside hydrolase n=1 Tax=Oryctes borbonicus TaxID=1629725 RepID=A0A0T6AYA6_9SCAR|nr:glycoside hydrolase [Oryctes borbonicus]